MAAEFVAGYERTLARWPASVHVIRRVPDRARG
jgi:hypothetical protein